MLLYIQDDLRISSIIPEDPQTHSLCETSRHHWKYEGETPLGFYEEFFDYKYDNGALVYEPYVSEGKPVESLTELEQLRQEVARLTSVIDNL